MATKFYRPAKRALTIPKSKGNSNGDKFVKYILIAALVILLAFTIVYIYNIHKMAVKLEKFTQVNKPKLTVVYIYSNTCGHCTRFSPVYESLQAGDLSSEKRFNNVELEIKPKIEKDSADPTYMEHVDAFPTVMLFKNGEFLKKMVGSVSKDELINFIASATI